MYLSQNLVKMVIKKIKLPNREIELDFLLAGNGSIGMPAAPDGYVPFNIFPRRCFDTVDFVDVTLFCGGSNTEKNLLLRILASKMGCVCLPEGMSERCLKDYLGLCCTVFAEADEERAVEVQLITKEQISAYVKEKYANIINDTSWSVLDFYDKTINSGSLCFIEEPEIGMSISEQIQFANLVYDLVRGSKSQFVITTNSPIIMGISRAVIYDFDRDVILPETWYSSSVAKEYARQYEDIKKKHRMK